MEFFRLVVALVVLCYSCYGAISFHATSVGASGSGGSGSALTLPTVSNGDLVIASISGDLFSSAAPAYSISGTGWTSLCNAGWGAHFYKVWHTGDPTSVTFTNLNGASTRNSTQGISYSGVDQTTPVDTFNCMVQYVNGWSTPIYFKAPATAPNWTNDLLFVSYYWGQGPPSWTPPAGFTTESYFASCVNCGYILYQDKQLSGGTVNTGDVNSQAPAGTSASGSNPSIGLQLLLKPASGTVFSPSTVYPTIAGVVETSCGGGGSINLGGSVYPQDWDLITYVSFGSTATPTGYNVLTTSANLSIFWRYWRTGNPTTILCSGFLQFVALHRNHRFSGGSSIYNGTPIGIDTWQKVTATAASVTLPALALATNNEYLTTWWADFTAGAGFSIPTGLNLDIAVPTWCISCTNNSNIEASNLAASNPTPSFTATNANSLTDSLIGGMVAYKMGANVTIVRHRAQWIDQF